MIFHVIVILARANGCLASVPSETFAFYIYVEMSNKREPAASIASVVQLL